eukprot:Gb_30685 [translate_table: standard]
MTVGAAEMASQPLLRCHLSSTTVSPRITRFSTVFPCPRLHSGANLFLSGFSKQPFCPRVSLEGVLRGKRRFQLLVKSVAGLNSGVSDIGTNGSWRRAVRDANLGQAIIPPPPEPPKDGSLPQVLSYIWNLAAGDSSLGWRLSVALILVFGSKVGLPSYLMKMDPF